MQAYLSFQLVACHFKFWPVEMAGKLEKIILSPETPRASPSGGGGGGGLPGTVSCITGKRV